MFDLSYPQLIFDKNRPLFIMNSVKMTKEELQSLAQKIREGKATDEEKILFVSELGVELDKASEILSKAQKDN